MNHNKQPENQKYFQAALRFVGFVTQPETFAKPRQQPEIPNGTAAVCRQMDY